MLQKIPLFGDFYVETIGCDGFLNRSANINIFSKTMNGGMHLLVSESISLNCCKIRVSSRGADITNLILRFSGLKSECYIALKVNILIPFWRLNE